MGVSARYRRPTQKYTFTQRKKKHRKSFSFMYPKSRPHAFFMLLLLLLLWKMPVNRGSLVLGMEKPYCGSFLEEYTLKLRFTWVGLNYSVFLYVYRQNTTPVYIIYHPAPFSTYPKPFFPYDDVTNEHHMITLFLPATSYIYTEKNSFSFIHGKTL